MLRHPSPEIINAGAGSLALVRFPPQSHIYAVPGSVVGLTSRMQVKRILNGGLLSIPRGFGGGHVTLDKLIAPSSDATASPDDVLLAPPNAADLAILSLSAAEYTVRPRALLALSSSLLLGTSLAFPDLSLKYSLHGSGWAILTAPGGVYRLVLRPNELYRVKHSHLLAWSSSMHPSLVPIHDSIKPATPNSSLLTKVSTWLARKSSELLDRVFRRNHVIQLKGPGDFYIASRL